MLTISDVQDHRDHRGEGVANGPHGDAVGLVAKQHWGSCLRLAAALSLVEQAQPSPQLTLSAGNAGVSICIIII